ncbi:hypothetical protein OA501_01530 [Flavobacteriaceae bacterium]|nr:hypothetical protein [Flavobacteriaceae bacterium]
MNCQTNDIATYLLLLLLFKHVVMPPNLDFCIGKKAIETAIAGEIEMGVAD